VAILRISGPTLLLPLYGFMGVDRNNFTLSGICGKGGGIVRGPKSSSLLQVCYYLVTDSNVKM
jgi:hypothetical protein